MTKAKNETNKILYGHSRPRSGRHLGRLDKTTYPISLEWSYIIRPFVVE